MISTYLLKSRFNFTVLVVFLICKTALAQITTFTFNYTGAAQNFTVPQCVYNLTVNALGAQGGGSNGGLGANVTGTMAVTPGQVLQVRVGGTGAQGAASGGFNGGGTGQASTGSAIYSSWGGGGATDIRIAPYALANRVIVAGGGGGRSGGSSPVCGGAANCLNGANGCNTYGAGGGGGTQIAGGNGGAPWAGTPPGGSPGVLGNGGQGGFWQTASGGGGGGGFYGGGGGGNDGCCTGANGGGGGGAGSSLNTPGGTCIPANRSGNGLLTITAALAQGTISVNSATVCNGSSAVLTASGGVTYTWIPSNSNLNAITVTPSVSSIYTVTGTSSSNCVGTQTTLVTVIDYPNYNLTPVNGLLCQGATYTPAVVFNNPVNPTQFSYQWSGGSGIASPTSSITAITAQPITGTISTIIYSVVVTPSANICPVTKTITLTVLNPSSPTITPVPTMCNNASIFQLQVSPNNGTWTPTSYYSTVGSFSPGLAVIGTNTVQYVIGTNTCNAQSTINVAIEAYVPAVITGSIADLCNTNPSINLVPLATNNIGNWSGSGVSSNVFNPANSGTGNIILTYNTASSPSSLCPAQATMAVKVFSLGTPNITKIGPFCNVGAPVQLQASPLGGVFAGINNGATTALGLFNPAFGLIGDNLISYTIVSGPCISIAQTTISVEKFISADLTQYAGPYCKNDPALNLNSLAQNPGGTWIGPGVLGSIFTPVFANTGNGNVIIYETHSSPTESLCPDTSAIRIQVNDIPNISIVSNSDKGCLPVEVIFNTPSTNAGTGQWNLGDGSGFVEGLFVTHTYTTPGSYQVSFNYQDEIGCATKVTLPYNINVYETPKAAFIYSPDDITIANPEVQFQNQSTVLGNNTYQWRIGDLYQLNQVNPSVIFPVAGDYQITLKATTINGCQDEVTKLVQIKNDFGVYIPNSFSPNFDNLNDVFLPILSPFGLDLKIYELEIFDRWGKSLFFTKDYLVGWNGTYKNKGDEPLKEDVYVYKIKFKDLDGKIHSRIGHLTLLK